MLSNLTCVLIYALTKCILEDGFKGSCVLKLLQNLQKISMMECTVMEVKGFRVATILKEVSHQI